MRYIAILIFVIATVASYSQKGVTTMGIQFKPIISSDYFGTGTQEFFENDVDFILTPKTGYVFGMVIRQGFTENLSLETGINMVRRNYEISSYDKEFNTSLELDFALVGYEIPVKGLFYIRLGDKLWMNAAGGLSFDFYPTNIFSNSYGSRDTLDYTLQQTTFRNNWLQMGVIANLGFEYRTKESGYFYLGASFHQPFTDIAITRVEYSLNGFKESSDQLIRGTYLTLDLRYFFNEKPERK